jgi:hypothetical protein
MKAVFTSAALADLDDVLSYTSMNYPSSGRRAREKFVSGLGYGSSR